MCRIILGTLILFFFTDGLPGEGGHPEKEKEQEKALLFPKEGRHPFLVSIKDADARAFFQQGITLYYGFNHAEAVRSFRRAAELDPKAAMPWWGIGLALGPNYNRDIDPVSPERFKAANEAARKALELTKAATPRERAFILALAKRYSPDPKADLGVLEEDYRQAMKKVALAYPDDGDAAVLYVEAIMNLRPWKLWDLEGKPAPDTEEAIGVLESVLRRDPDHIGACHYLIHALEASPTPERALPAADRLMRRVPWLGHLTHMPGHIYIHTGDFDRAALSNDLAIRADEAFFKLCPDKGVYRSMYFPHNIHFLAYAHACGGKFKEAAAAAKMLADVVEPNLEHMPMLEGFAVFPLLIDLRFHRWEDVLKMPEPTPKRIVTRLFRHYARAIAHAALGKFEAAAPEHLAFTGLKKMIPADTPMGTNTAGQVLLVAEKTLQARLTRDSLKAIPLWREVVALEDKLNYGEPPDWIFRGRENLGACFLRSGQAGEAEKVFREDLRKLRRSGRALLGLEVSLRAQKREEEADLVLQAFERAWPRETLLRLEDY